MRIPHGQELSLEKLSAAEKSLKVMNREIPLPFSIEEARENRFDYLFPNLQEDDATLLPESPQTRTQLIELGITMRDKGGTSNPDSATPSAYTYFGQFVDHEITLEAKSDTLFKLGDPNLGPLPREIIKSQIRNSRSPFLDLDSVYGKPAVRDGEKMLLGRVSPNPVRPPGKDDLNDVPRLGPSSNRESDRAALIGDARNDENLIV